MCWSFSKYNHGIAKEDIEVYKIGKVTEDNHFVTPFRKYVYGVDIFNETIELAPHRIDITYHPVIKIYKGYHSYAYISFCMDSLTQDFVTPFGRIWDLVKSIYTGDLKERIRVDNPYSIGTFIIPKGSEYYESHGVLVSSNIIYTGKHLKL